MLHKIIQQLVIVWVAEDRVSLKAWSRFHEDLQSRGRIISNSDYAMKKVNQGIVMKMVKIQGFL